MLLYDPKDDASLWPEEACAVTENDEMKHPSSDGYIIILSQFDSPEDVAIPTEKEGNTYHIHAANREPWFRSS